MVSQTQLQDLFEYRDGGLYWRVKTNRRIRFEARAGGLNRHGYRQVRIGGKRYQEHRLIYMMHHGYFPEFLDRINGVRDDNRIENLRPCTFQQNQYNAKTLLRNTSGVKGVSLHKRTQRWRARISVNGTVKSLRYFDTVEEARVAIEAARIKYHGEFARF